MPAPQKAAGEAVTRHQPQKPRLSWTILPPEGRTEPAPPMPACTLEGGWSDGTVEAWRKLWALPQATQWQADDSELAVWILIHETIWYRSPKGPSPTLISQMRGIDDKHGLNPRAMRDLVWRIGDSDEGAAVKPKRKQRRSVDLKLV